MNKKSLFRATVPVCKKFIDLSISIYNSPEDKNVKLPVPKHLILGKCLAEIGKMIPSLDSIVSTAIKTALEKEKGREDWFDADDTVQSCIESIYHIGIFTDLNSPGSVVVCLSGSKLYGGHGIDIEVKNGSISRSDMGGNLDLY